MKHRYFRLARTIVAVVGIVWLGWVPAGGQGPAETAKAPTDLPRTPDGQPDIQGHWGEVEIADKSKNFWAYSLDGRGTEYHQRGRGWEVQVFDAVVLAPGGTIPYQPWAQAKREEYLIDRMRPKRLEHVDTRSRCILGGVPRDFYQGGSPQIIQTPEYVLLLTEWDHKYRTIRLDGGRRLGSNVKLWMGDSHGRWEGNTLIVETTNMKPGWLDNSGNFYRETMRVVERWTVVDPNTIHWEATMEDPKVYTSPWKLAFTMKRRDEQGYELMEAACHEGNHHLKVAFPTSWMAHLPR